jgi:KDO2-lipid IV(A) lauroyltransferase
MAAADGRDFFRYACFWAGLKASRLAPESVAYALARAVADFNHWKDKRGRAAVAANLARARPGLSPEELRLAVKNVFRHFAMYLYEFAKLRAAGADFFRARVAFEGLERVDAARTEGRGALVVSAHLSNWELGIAALAARGYPVTVSAAMHREPRVNAIFMRERRGLGLRVVDAASPGAAKELLRALARNEVVGLLGDRDPTAGGFPVPFFGADCRFPQGPARLALARGTPILPAFCEREPGGRFRIVFEEPLSPGNAAADEAAGGKKDRARALATAFARTLERAIRRRPDHWTIFYSPWDDEWTPR